MCKQNQKQSAHPVSTPPPTNTHTATVADTTATCIARSQSSNCVSGHQALLPCYFAF